MKNWWHRSPITFEGAIILLVMIALIILAVVMIAHRAYSASYLWLEGLVKP